MSLLFYIDPKNEGIVLRPDCYKLHPELAPLDEQELMLIILTYDYHSPYRQFPEPERRRKAIFHVYGENMMEKYDEITIKNAIEAYKSLQFIPEIHQVEIYQRKIAKLNQQIEEDDEASISTTKNNLATILMFEDAIRDLEKRAIDSTVTKGQIKGGQELSFLEDMMKSEKYYKSVIHKK